jgi:tripartite-type tricarboxylate transporter receptor subunit TctC
MKSVCHRRRTFLKFAAAAVVAPAFSHLATAQSYPTRPITMVVPYPPGGATDVIARNLAERMKASLGQPVIIENVTGAGGTLGSGRVAHARPDGYTLGIGQVDTHVINGATYALQYEVLNHFEPVALRYAYQVGRISGRHGCRGGIAEAGSSGAGSMRF